MLEIRTLGGLSIKRDGEQVSGLASRKAEALLAYLACTEREHPREVLAELLWQERTQERAMANLRVALSSLRQKLGEYITITRDMVTMNPESETWLDVVEMEKNLVPVHDADFAAQVERAVELYQGEFLAGFYLRGAFGFEEWAALERERLGQAVVQALSDLVAYDLASGSFRSGIAHANRLLALDPLMESAHRQMMLLLAASGQRGAALGQYESYRRLLNVELGAEPSEEIKETYELLLSGERPPGIPAAAEIVERELEVAGECPYRGLAAFREEDAPFFFGREDFVASLFQAVRERPLWRSSLARQDRASRRRSLPGCCPGCAALTLGSGWWPTFGLATVPSTHWRLRWSDCWSQS
jgi:DNA-binding SARP family transcriptional activator